MHLWGQAPFRFVYIYQICDEQKSKTNTKKLVILFENEVVRNSNFIEL